MRRVPPIGKERYQRGKDALGKDASSPQGDRISGQRRCVVLVHYGGAIYFYQFPAYLGRHLPALFLSGDICAEAVAGCDSQLSFRNVSWWKHTLS